jgi:hypothetical protein
MNDEAIWFIIWLVAFILFIWCRRNIKRLIKASQDREAMSREVEKKIGREDK